eukprot:GHVN01106399.1.p1 GENE.GHVN01106399.1~~GHVN01106399.1.p1  ORF type:complete len:570 (+),score=193.47 GHVN01106399.1:208-1710(+)
MALDLVSHVCEVQATRPHTLTPCPPHAVEHLTQGDVETPRGIQAMGSNSSRAIAMYERYRADVERSAVELRHKGVTGLKMSEVRWRWAERYPNHPPLSTLLEEVGVMTYGQLFDSVKGVAVIGSLNQPNETRCIVRRTRAESEVGRNGGSPVRWGTAVIPGPGQGMSPTSAHSPNLSYMSPMASRVSPLSSMGGVPSPPPPSLASSPSPSRHTHPLSEVKRSIYPRRYHPNSMVSDAMKSNDLFDALEKSTEAMNSMISALASLSNKDATPPTQHHPTNHRHPPHTHPSPYTLNSFPSPRNTSHLNNLTHPTLQISADVSGSRELVDITRFGQVLSSVGVNAYSVQSAPIGATATPVSSPMAFDHTDPLTTPVAHLSNTPQPHSLKMNLNQTGSTDHPDALHHLFPPTKQHHFSASPQAVTPTDPFKQSHTLAHAVHSLKPHHLFGSMLKDTGSGGDGAEPQILTHDDFMKLKGAIEVDGLFRPTDAIAVDAQDGEKRND